MASLQIPFSRWDWQENACTTSNNRSNRRKSVALHNSNANNNNQHHQASTAEPNNLHSHTSGPSSPNNSHSGQCKTRSFSFNNSLAMMLSEGQAVLAHQTCTEIWLFIGLNSGAIWKWTLKKSAQNEQQQKAKEGKDSEMGEKGAEGGEKMYKSPKNGGRIDEEELSDIIKDSLKLDPKYDLKAEFVMTAHKSPIKALAMSKYRVDCTGDAEEAESCLQVGEKQQHSFMESLVSVDESGELAVWNCWDGRCLLHNLRATASTKSSGYPNNISVSPNYEYCVLSGYSDKLVVLRLSSLEIVQIVEVGGISSNALQQAKKDNDDKYSTSDNSENNLKSENQPQPQQQQYYNLRMPRWVRASGFLLQDDPNLLLDYLTLNFNAPASESLTARQFDHNLGKFVSPACPILPPTIPTEQLKRFATCHLLTCSRANPGLAALVTDLKHVWLIDFLSGDHASFSLDFEIDGVEFARADLLLVWSKAGKLAFYNIFIQPLSMATGDDEEGSNNQFKRSKSPILGHVVRKLDLKCPFPIGNRLHLKLLPTASSSRDCASILWLETVQKPQKQTQVSIVHVEFDSECPDRTVTLSRENDSAYRLLFNDTGKRNIECSASNTNNSNTFSPVTCTITCEPDWLFQGHVDGQISRRKVCDFFSDELQESTGPLAENHPNFNNYPVTCMLAFARQVGPSEGILVVAGDSQGQIQFWFSGKSENGGDKQHKKVFQFLGVSRCHLKKITGLVQRNGTIFSWSSDGVVGMYSQSEAAEKYSDSFYGCKHMFHPPANNLALTGLYWRIDPDSGNSCLLLDYRASSSAAAAIVHVNWNLTTGHRLPDLTDSVYLETLSMSDLKVPIDAASPSYKAPDNSGLFDGTISVLSDGRQWPELPCHSLLVDIRGLARKLSSKNYSSTILEFGRRVLSQFMAWGVSERMDRICRDGLNLAPNSDKVRYGLQGANGNVSFILNPRCRDRFWTLSPTLTATLQLAIILLLESINFSENEVLEGEGDGKADDKDAYSQSIYSLITFYAAQIGDLSSPPNLPSCLFRPGALSFISKFWQDSDSEIQKAARLLFSTTFARLSPLQQKILIDYWKDSLPTSNSSGSTDARSMYRSAIILGIIGIQEPESLSRSTKKHVAESLVTLLLDGKRNIFRLAAIELVGRGYSIWLPFIHGASIFKLLYSWLVQLYGGDENFYQTTLKAIIHILSLSESSNLANNINANANANAGIANTTTTTTTSPSQLSDSVSTLSVSTVTSSASISRKSSHSNLQASASSSSNSPLVGWLTDLQSREINLIERKCALQIIKSLLDFKPICFQGHEGLLVEAVMRINCERGLSLFTELDKQFGLISLHARSQRIAVSLPDNSIAVYDLKSITISEDAGNATSSTAGSSSKNSPASSSVNTIIRTALLQGHVHPCTLVAFNPDRPDGKQLLSYSSGEACIRWWNLSSSSSSSSSGTSTGSSGLSQLFSSLTGGGNSAAASTTADEPARPGLKPVKIVIVQPELTRSIDDLPTGSVFKMNPINLQWNLTQKVVEFRVATLLVQTLPII